MFDLTCDFEPTFTLNGIPISPGSCQALTSGVLAGRIGREGKSLVAVAHLALLGVKIQARHFGFLLFREILLGGESTEEEREASASFFIVLFSDGEK